MKNKTWWIFPLLFVVILVTITTLIVREIGSQQESFKGVSSGSEYHTTSTASYGITTARQIETIATSTNWQRVFGYITVASSSAATLTVKNATSTTDIASTTIAVLRAGIAEGTYQFDAVMTRGLIIDVPVGFHGDYVIGYR